MDQIQTREKIGKGRSGVVYKSSDSFGNMLAIKVFSGGDFLTKLVNYVLTGAPNAYSWNEDAVASAHLRRKILAILLPHWFGSRLKIARSYGYDWNKELKAYELNTAFIEGRPTSLHHPFSQDAKGEYDDLCYKVMAPLQEKLLASGFEGLVWQAGKANPVALNNFLLDNDGKWVWIDAESGVPAVFPLNPLTLLFFYLPKAFRYRHFLFDDVDTEKLANYVSKNRDQFEEAAFNQLNELTKQLQNRQDKWRSVGRSRKSIIYKLKTDRITQQQADWYNRHLLLWYGRELTGVVKQSVLKIAVQFPLWTLKKISAINFREIIKNSYRLIFDAKFRKSRIEKYLNLRISEWKERGQLDFDQTQFLQKQVKHESASPYLADFMIVLALKPITQVIELLLLPSLFAAGLISAGFLAVGVAFGGIIYRTLYTLSKMLYEQVKFAPSQQHSRVIALLVGLIPTVGNAAYPVQMVYSATTRKKELAAFMIYDLLSAIGRKIPVWGGKDTRTEHFFNHIPDWIVRKRIKLKTFSKKKKTPPVSISA